MSNAVEVVRIGDGPIAWQDVVAVARDRRPLQLSVQAWARIQAVSYTHLTLPTKA